MKTAVTWLAGVLLFICLAAVAGLLALQHWVGSDDFRVRVQSQAESMLGVPVALGGLQIDPWPGGI